MTKSSGNALFTVVPAAFAAGWCAAGGDPPVSQPVVSIVKKQDKE